MLFGAKLRPVSDFLPRVLAHVSGANVDMVTTYIMDAVIQFLRDTKLLTEVICFPLESCVSSYKLRTPNRITEILSVRFFTYGVQQPSHRYQYRIEDDTFYIDGRHTQRGDTSVEVEFAVAPLRDSENVPDVLYEEWVDAITALTLAKLYLLTDNEWYNPKGAENQLMLYQQLVRQVRFTRVTKHKPFNMRLLNKRRF